jgi:hypothetical protein
MMPMRIDFTRLLIVLVLLTLIQRFVPGLLVTLGVNNLFLIFIILDFVMALVIVYSYIPPRFWKHAHKSPDFHRLLVTYFLILLALSALNLFL